MNQPIALFAASTLALALVAGCRSKPEEPPPASPAA